METNEHENHVETEDKKKYGWKQYKSDDLIVHWNLSHCSHAGKCVKALPKVFDSERKPWIKLDEASAEEVIKAIDLCPSGALLYELTENSKVDPELAKGPGAKGYKTGSPSVEIRMVKNGPLVVKGDVKIIGVEGNLLRECASMVLCRCGRTSNPPFCDGAHEK